MILTEFRIRNFRSIKDSGWNTLSPDNITALIGQNESGKTTVLEALYSFRQGTISEDVLRSDMTLPEVSCSFLPPSADDFSRIDAMRVPEKVLAAIKRDNKLTLTRKWLPDLGSRLTISGSNISEIFDEIEQQERELTENTLQATGQALEEYRELREECSVLQDNILLLNDRFRETTRRKDKLQKQLKRSKDPARQEAIRQELEPLAVEHRHLAEKIRAEESALNELWGKLEERETLRMYGEQCLRIFNDLENTLPEHESAWKLLEDAEESITYLAGEREKKAGNSRLLKARENYIRLNRHVETLRERAGICIRLVRNLISGMEYAEAEKQAASEYSAQNQLFTREETGGEFFRHVPHFEFFEDFGSLLPNRVDIDDIIEENTRIEGYKAVCNFLAIAGLDPQFLRQSNNRIRKQKIENLNNEVTVDFQEYWRQNIGQTNKIKINFELEHYDIYHPEKKGRPYLEFWIKDDHERLYPKQRSRGVRWFLSFYLELKAFARNNSSEKRVLLIDEPGLSLHARAQEDVLKVFEDIKGTVQIIYSTHSPHLIDHGKLYRLLAVQRARDNREQSETLILDATHLHSATSDTLSPVNTFMGVGLNPQQLAMKSGNVIVEDITAFYYLSSLFRLSPSSPRISFLPANGPATVNVLVNLFLGWGLEFSVLLFDNAGSHDIVNEIKLQLGGFDPSEPDSRLILMKNITAPEDLFSTLDFKKYIINKRVGIPDGNTEWIRDNGISRPLLASGFSQNAGSGIYSFDSFDEETRRNLEYLFESVMTRFSS